MRRLALLGGAVLWLTGLGLLAQEQSFFAGSPAVGVTAEQANRGKAVYDDNCGSCHGTNLDNGEFGPPLRGSAFKMHWASQSANALFTYITTKMPPAAPGGLSDRAYSDAEAYILRANGVAIGNRELAPARTQSEITARTINKDATYQSVIAAREKLLAGLTPVTEGMLQHPADGDWLVWRGSYQNLAYSPLKQIDTANVHDLGIAWTLALPVSGNETTPLVHDGILFVESGASIQALNGATGEVLWQYTRPLPERLHNGQNARMKNLAIYGDSLYAPTPDGHVIALETKTGKLLWDHAVFSRDNDSQAGAAGGPAPFSLTGGPVVAKGKVMIGTSLGINTGGGNYIVALDAATGKEAWRFNTIAKPGEPGGDSWNGAPYEQRFGGGVWTSGSYDPARNLVYFGTGNTYDIGTLMLPQPRVGESKDALYTDSTLALDPDTGKLVWHAQHMKRDVWDLDWVFEQSLLTLPVNGKPTELVVTGGKTAIFDAMDRATGKHVFSRDLGLQNIVTGIDPETGEETKNPALEPEPGKTKLLCPDANGARNWPTTAFDPASYTLYVPLIEDCAEYSWTPRSAAKIAAGGDDIHFAQRPRPDSDGKFGRIEAINLATGRVLWIHRQRAPLVSSLLATGGGLVFVGALDRFFSAYHAATGELLWQTQLNAAPNSSPVTYSVQGEQYVAVVAGGGFLSAASSRFTPEIDNPAGGTTLWVFKLPSR
ncbi:MAG TPA: PQQ-binding-like beta-propeller repeat protein [Bryobacteraceae bacterium]|nr:PQQ-binding-like beta-propeller repeat protein [Bryobacteraceae bacterium]